MFEATGYAIYYVTGAGGSGKSYYLTRHLIRDRLIGSDVRIVTNLPLKAPIIADYVAQKRGCHPDDVMERICLLPREVLRSWADGDAGPWDLYSDKPDGFAGFELVLDEVHKFCPTARGGADAKRTKHWTSWLGEARHEEWERIIFATQDVSKVGKPIDAHAEVSVEFTKQDRRRDPWMGIILSDWYELRAGISGSYVSKVNVAEKRRVNGKWVPQHSETFAIEPEWFQYYESYSKPGGGTASGAGQGKEREHQKRHMFLPSRDAQGWKVPLILWFLARNWWRCGRSGAIAAFIGFMMCGGGVWIMGAFFAFFQLFMPGGSPEISSSAAPVAPVVAGPMPGQVRPDGGVMLTREQAEQERQYQVMREEQELACLVLLSPDHVVTMGGEQLQVGQTFQVGPFKGAKLESVDLRTRTALISGDRRLRARTIVPAETPRLGELPTVGPK